MKKYILYSIIFVASILLANRVYSEDAGSSVSAENNSARHYNRKNMLAFAAISTYRGFGFEYLRYLNRGNSISSSIGIGFSSLDDHYSYMTESQPSSSGIQTITYFFYDNDVTALSFPLNIGFHPVTIWGITPFLKPGVAFLFPVQKLKYSDTDAVYTLLTAETGLEFTMDYFSMQLALGAANTKPRAIGPVLKFGLLF